MDKILNASNNHEYLTAFADGELDAGQILAVLNHLSTHLEALEMMRGQQPLRLQAPRVVRDNTPPVPNELRGRIQAVAEQTDKLIRKCPNRNESPAWLKNSTPRPRKQLSAEVAASALLGIVLGNLMSPYPSTTPKTNAETASAVPPTLVTSVTKIHVDCSRFEPQRHAGPFPTAPRMTHWPRRLKGNFTGKCRISIFRPSDTV